MRVIIAGGGRLGLQTAELLDNRGEDVVVIEENPDAVERVVNEYVATVIEGDASKPSILTQAKPDEAEVVAALTDHPGTNLAIAMEAKQMNADLRTVARIETTDDEEYLEFVDDVVFPEEAGAHVAANQIVGSDVVTLSEVTGRVNILEIRIAEEAPVAGRTLEEISMPDGSQVVSDSEGGTIARAETVLQPGRRYIFAAEPAVVDDVMNLVRG